MRVGNQKHKYMLFMYKESDNWGSDYERSDYYKVFTDNVNDLVSVLYVHGWMGGKFRSDWDITTIVSGFVVDKESFRGMLEQKDREAEEARKEYAAKLEARRAEEERERLAMQDTIDYQNYLVLRSRFAHLEQ